MLIKDMKEKVKKEIMPYSGLHNKCGVVFQAPFFSSVIEEKHFTHLKPVNFKWEHNVDHVPYGDLMTEFPEKGWRCISYNKVCRKVPYTKEFYMKESLNKYLRELGNTHTDKQYLGTCEDCNSSPAVDMHHVKPTFDEIFNTVLTHIPEESFKEADWFAPFYWVKLLNPKAMKVFWELTHKAQYKNLCKDCHHKYKGKGEKS